ncbi:MULTISPECIES: hypothetical protein [unclassified Streptomyces]|uniref:hypothetical protein n=1 Tax=unclassified Streptomyces TaxID=2593676 RepID=UPI0006F54019|nr:MULTISPECIES: hypothetical protein [unclassified Streptomyces]KQX47472.1 hypothetical protein ASD33_22075 [Streptomyces sp. Root1304]KRA94780.1 hypothetical protein ASE09_31300 [Streptomyces sp. Root66D1]
MDTKTTTEKKTGESADGAEGVERAETAKTAAIGPVEDTTPDLLDKGDKGDEDGDGAAAEGGDGFDGDDELDEELSSGTATASTGIGGAAAAVVSAALGVVALTGTWTGKVVSERETLVGQIKTSGTGTPAQQISEIYGDAWHSTALVNGVFAFVALFVAVLVLILPGRPAWVRSVAVAGAVLGGLGLLLSAGTYFDLFMSLPTAGS